MGLYEVFKIINGENIACYDIGEKGMCVIDKEGTAKIFNFENTTEQNLHLTFLGAEKITISDDLNFILATSSEHGYYIFRDSGVYEKYNRASLNYIFNKSANVATKFISNLTFHYKTTNGVFELVTSAVNIFPSSDIDKLLNSAFLLAGYIGKRFYICNHTGTALSAGSNESEVVAVSGDLSYFLLKFNNGALRLFRLNRKNMFLMEMTHEPLISGEYIFAGNRLLCINKNIAQYEIDLQFCEIRFFDNPAGTCLVTDREQASTSYTKIQIKAAANNDI